ncbi:mutator type transposase [Tanacetum coccineum]
MDDLVQDFFIKPEGDTFDLDVYASSECIVDWNGADQYQLKSYRCGVKTLLVSESDYRRFLGYVKKHKVMDVYVEIVEKNEESESGSDSASESDNDFEDEEHVVQEVEVNMGYFNFQVEDASTGTDGNMIPVAPKVNLTEDNIEVLEFDSLESDLEDVPENDRRVGNLHFFENDPIRIRVVCNGVVPCKNLVTYKVPGPNVDNAVKGKIVNEDAEEDKITCPWLLYLSKGDKGKWRLWKIQYALLRDYVMELKRCNPYTTVKIDVYGEEDPESPTRLFRRIYVCLGALKKGFREGGRELLGLDGAFMRGRDDFDLYSNSNFTFITDRQKGLLPALEKLFPHAEHRYCVRHIYENMNLILGKESEYKEMLWKCASSTTTVLFEKNMQELKDFNKKAYEWLKQIPAEHWSRAYFSGRAHCDLLINNICEVFNRQLLEARDSPIITALEHVREYLMKRIVVVQKIIEKCDGPLTPAVARVFDIIKEASSECIVDWNGADQYQVKGYLQEQYVVNLNQRTCSCRKWEISGIPCKHAIAAIHDMADNGNDVGIPEDWVHDSYKLATWKAVYSHKVNPVNGRELWSKFDCPTTLLPPKIHPQIGRPPKKRKKSKGEIVMVKGNKLTRQGKTVTCSLCHAAGHNKRSCDRRQPSQGGTSNAAGVGTQPSEGGTSNAAGVGPQASQGGTSNAAGVGTQPSEASQGGTSNAAGTKRKSKGSTGTSNAAGTQASQASKGGTSNAGTQASTGSPLKRTKKSAKIIDLSSSIEAQIDGSEPGNEGSSMPHLPPFGSVGRPRPEVPANIAKRFKEGDITRELVKWYGYVDILEYFEDDAYWDSYSPTTDEKEVPLGKYIPIGKHAAARPIIKSETFKRRDNFGVANQKTWAAIEEKLRKRPSKH